MDESASETTSKTYQGPWELTKGFDESVSHRESWSIEIQVQTGQDWNPDVESAGRETNSN